MSRYYTINSFRALHSRHAQAASPPYRRAMLAGHTAGSVGHPYSHVLCRMLHRNAYSAVRADFVVPITLQIAADGSPSEQPAQTGNNPAHFDYAAPVVVRVRVPDALQHHVVCGFTASFWPSATSCAPGPWPSILPTIKSPLFLQSGQQTSR
jgi:hypothetical protein